MSKNAFLTAALTLACLGVQAAEPGDLLSLGPVEQSRTQDLNDAFDKLKKDVAAHAQDYQTFGLMVAFQKGFQKRMANGVPSRQFTYASKDSHGHERKYSARVFLPYHASNTAPLALPIVVYQHATETRRKFTPYFLGGDETMLGAMAAQMGEFAVVMPDGDGMGVDPSPEMHAYCHGPTTAQCVIDCIRAVRSQLKGTGERVFDDEDYGWDGRTFIMGYSEGGYIAMAAVKEICTNPACSDLKLTGAACMGGPFDFTNSLLDLLKKKDKPEPYDRPYIPAYFVDAWQSVYPDLVNFKEAINPKLLPDLGQWLDEGILGGDQLSPKIQEKLTGKKDTLVTTRDIMNPEWLKANIDDPKSRLIEKFKMNDLVGGWAPTMKVLLVHDPYDTTVSYDSTRKAFESWSAKGPKPVGIVDLAVGGKGTGHVVGAVVAIPTAFTWFAANMPETFTELAKQKISDTVMELVPGIMRDGADALALAVVGEKDEDKPLLPLSRIKLPEGPGARPCYVKIGDKWYTQGKVKFFTRDNQGRTKFIAERSSKSQPQVFFDPKDLRAQGFTDLYVAVYPDKTLVDLTLKFGTAIRKGNQFEQDLKEEEYTVNIKQALKNKVANRDPDAVFKLSGNINDNKYRFKLSKDAFERPDSPTPFIALP